MKRLFILFVLVCAASVVLAQKPKSFFSAGEKMMLAKNYKGAIEQFSQAIGLDPRMSQAYLARAIAYDQNGQYAEGLEDYRKMGSFKIKDFGFYYDAALICHKLQLYDEGLSYVEKVMGIKKKRFDALILKTKLQMAKGDYANAVFTVNSALEEDNIPLLHYFKAICLEQMDNFPAAEKSYLNAILLKNNYIDALNALARLQIKMEKPDKALANCNKVISVDANNKEAYLIRAAVYAKKLDYPSAINDLSRNIMLNPDDLQLYLTRGIYYQEFTQHQNAINDFTKVLMLNDKQIDAYYKRAFSYEQVGNYPLAIKDYHKLNELSKSDEKAKGLLDAANKRLFELNRESDNPQLVLVTPRPNVDMSVNVPKDKVEINIDGLVIDASDIKTVLVNSVLVPIAKNEKGAAFTTQINVAIIDSFMVSATDIYGNTSNSLFRIKRTETGKPIVAVLSPYASDNNEIFLQVDSESLYVEGQIMDESPMATISIDGVLASFMIDELNPKFIATIPILNKDRFTVIAKDIFGNYTEREFLINRQGASQADSNPMGRTWAIFIENSNYDKFPSLDGPSRDVSLMRTALANYDIQNIIHKRNMSKTDMERFFAIELRDLIKKNNVRSVMIWYAGHGKFVNETGYWIPVDANRDDEFSYFSINSLKASMQNYNTILSHTLVITDACESGPTFYQAMRGNLTVRSCNDWEASKLKSSQVFTSAGYELASDNSQFTKTFANMLANNPNSCIPIETIVLKVTQVVSQNNQQQPKFGKIAGLADEDGTFFFINSKK